MSWIRPARLAQHLLLYVLSALVLFDVGQSVGQDRYRVRFPEKFAVPEPNPIPAEYNGHAYLTRHTPPNGGATGVDFWLGVADSNQFPEQYSVTYIGLHPNDKLPVLSDIYRVNTVNPLVLSRLPTEQVGNHLTRTPGSFALPQTRPPIDVATASAKLQETSFQVLIDVPAADGILSAILKVRTDLGVITEHVVRSGDTLVINAIPYRVCKIVVPDKKAQVYGWIELLPMELHIRQSSHGQMRKYQGLRRVGFEKTVSREGTRYATNLLFYPIQQGVTRDLYEFRYHSVKEGQLICVLGDFYRVVLSNEDELILERVLEATAAQEVTTGGYILPVATSDDGTPIWESASLHNIKMRVAIKDRSDDAEAVAVIRMKSTSESKSSVDREVSVRVGDAIEIGNRESDRFMIGKAKYRVVRIVRPSDQIYGWVEIVPVDAATKTAN